MTFNKVYIGQELPLSIRLGEDIDGQTFAVLNSDGSAYDFSAITDLNMFIYERRGSEIIGAIAQGTGASSVSVSVNTITLNAVYEDDLFAMKDTGRYFYEMQHLDANGLIINTFFGPLKVK